jgi:CBS domain-containing protein
VTPEQRVSPEDNLRTATETLLLHKLREIPVIDAAGQLVGLLDEADVSRFYLENSTKTPAPVPTT